jgi:hypothetical protein
MRSTKGAIAAALVGIGLASAAVRAEEKRGGKSPGAAGDAPPTSATESTQTLERLRKLVHVEPTASGKDGRFLLDYNLHDEPQQLDFVARGISAPEPVLVHVGTVKGTHPELAAESDEAGLFLHKVPVKGDLDIECTFYVRCIDEHHSSFTFLMGYDPKTRHWVGARNGQSLVVCDGRRITPEVDPAAADWGPFLYLHHAVVKLTRRGDCVSLFLNGTRQSSVMAPHADGCWGILASNVRIGILRWAVTCHPDLPPEAPAKTDNKP